MIFFFFTIVYSINVLWTLHSKLFPTSTFVFLDFERIGEAIIVLPRRFFNFFFFWLKILDDFFQKKRKNCFYFQKICFVSKTIRAVTLSSLEKMQNYVTQTSLYFRTFRLQIRTSYAILMPRCKPQMSKNWHWQFETIFYRYFSPTTPIFSNSNRLSTLFVRYWIYYCVTSEPISVINTTLKIYWYR